MAPSPRITEAAPVAVSFRDALLYWLKLGFISFGGPAGQIAMMHAGLVERRRWISERRFLHALNFCMLLPGPEATELAVYIGWLLHRTAGGLVAGTLFVLPGYIALMVLSAVYAAFGKVGAVQALFFGLKAAVLAVVLEAVVRIGRHALRNRAMVGVAAAAFVGIFFLKLPFPLIILAAGVVGFLGARAGVPAFLAGGGHGPGKGAVLADADSALGEEMPAHARPDLGWALRVAAVCLLLWLGPVLTLLAALGPGATFTQVAVFFSKMAVVTFGGAYAVL